MIPNTHTPMLNAFEFSPDEKKIVSGTDGGLVQIWEMETGIELSSFFEEQPPIDGSYQDPITTFAYSSDTIVECLIKQMRIFRKYTI